SHQSTSIAPQVASAHRRHHLALMIDRTGPSASSSSLERVIRVSAFGVGGVSGFGLGSLVAPSDVGADSCVLLCVGAVVGAGQGEVAYGGELGFDPVQPGGVGR